MARARVSNKPRIVSANHLMEGDVMYRTSTGGWSAFLIDAHVVTADVDADGFLAEALSEPHLVVDPGLHEVEVDADGAPRPVSARERIRALGPTVRRDLGKQADQRDAGAAAAEREAA